MSHRTNTQKAYSSYIPLPQDTIHVNFHGHYNIQPPLATPPLSSTFSTSTDHAPGPKLGETRCYWALMTADLQFIYLDPVLASHLDTEADLLVGKSLLAFVHPDEQQTAKQDLGSALESKALHGSVARVRFSRLQSVRRRLGFQESSVSWTGDDRITPDHDYLPVDIVINWAAEGLVLCFIHACVDLSPNDNDEHQKTGWSNWCETPELSQDQIELLLSRLLVCLPETSSISRVFQILANQPERQLLLSWPPGPLQSTEATGHDFAKLVEDVTMDLGSQTDAKTTCTRRYKALHDSLSFGGEVESIFIPHGSIIFSCHKVNPSFRNTTNSAAAMQQLAFTPASYNPPLSTSYYDQPTTYSLSSTLSSHDAYAKVYMSQARQGSQTSYPTAQQQWGTSTMPPSLSNLRTGSYLSSVQEHQVSQWQQSTASAQGAYLDTIPSPTFSRPLTPPYPYSPTNHGLDHSPSDVVPPPRRRISPTARETGPTRTPTNRPAGILKCSSCKATSSPEWRKGPSGKKELCNACGLRYARSRAKKEGQAGGQRRRKEKPLPKKDSELSPISVPSTAYPQARRSSTDVPFPGSHGSDYFSSGPHSLDKMTPSPSPPTPTMSFVHYSPNDTRPSYGHSTSYYPAPSPLSHPPYGAHADSALPHSTQANATQLPPLGQLSAYAGRLSPLASSPTPGPQASPVSAMSMSMPSRDRARDYYDLPPTPLSAEPRPLKRSFCNGVN
ncbi:hypothetical protein BKA70DRAFT_1561909 [Coprinopsis sp. MPI-PUGE-AT-0042]|nr:hypothetical protein BKA70DRAFT_1561909 [Coprinopsis sp. MPI-PUGE-AT-0042]